jgi:nucleoside-triphosphatase THEP1
MPVLLLVASSGVGKTTACERAVEMAQAQGWRVAGVLSRPVWQAGVKTAIRLREVPLGPERILARAQHPDDGPRVGVWTFDPAGVAWGQHILTSLRPCDLLVIDEIGPLELEQGQGLTSALGALRQAAYRQAVVTLRPTLVETLLAKLDGLDVSTLALDERTREVMPHILLAHMSEGLYRLAR